MGKLVQGFRPGVLIHTTAGTFRNGSNPTVEQVEAIEKLGYKLEGHSETVEQLIPTFSVMRSEQIQAENEGRAEADKRADEVAQRSAATQPDNAPGDKTSDKKKSRRGKNGGEQSDTTTDDTKTGDAPVAGDKVGDGEGEGDKTPTE